MDKNQKSTDMQHKTSTAPHSDKETAKTDTSSKKMMDHKSDAKSDKGMHAASGKSTMGDKSSKGK